MEREYNDLINEAAHVTFGAVTRRLYTRTVWTLRTLYETDPYWSERVPMCFEALRNTWLMNAVTKILSEAEDSDRWLEKQYDEENFRHPEKTPARMAEIAELSGLARIMFTSTANKRWVPPLVKAYWFVLSWEPDDRELPHRESMVLTTGHQVSVFPF